MRRFFQFQVVIAITLASVVSNAAITCHSAHAKWQTPVLADLQKAVALVLGSHPPKVQPNLEAIVAKAALAGWSPEHTKKMVSIIGDVDQLVSSELMVPKIKTPIFKAWDSNAYALSAWDFMILPGRFTFNERMVRAEASHVYPIWVHEYGHLIFQTNLKRHPHFKELFADEPRPDELSIALSEASKKMNRIKELRGRTDRDALAEMARLTTIDTVELVKMRRTIERAKLLNLTRAYDELFADLLAVVYFADGAAILKSFIDYKDLHDLEFKVIYHNYLPKEAEAVKELLFNFKARDFTVDRPISGWEGRGPHILLSPTRSYLYKHVLQVSPYAKHPAKVLRAVFDAIASETARLYVSNLKPENIDPSALNGELIRAIDASLAKIHGLVEYH